MRKMLFAAAAASLLCAAPALAQTGNVTVQQITDNPQVAVTNTVLVGALKDLDIGSATIGANVQVEADNTVNLQGPGWVSANTGIGGQNVNGNQSSLTNSTAVGAGRDLSIGSQAIGANASAEAWRVNVNDTLSQRVNNVEQTAVTNTLLTVAGRDLSASAVAGGANLRAVGDNVVNIGGPSDAPLQLINGSQQYATLNSAGFLAGRDLGLSSQAFGGSVYASANTVNATFSQDMNMGDPWPVAQAPTQTAITNAFGGLALRDGDISSTALGLSASFEASNVNLDIGQTTYGGAQTALTNVGLVGFGRNGTVGSTAVGVNISVKAP